MVEVLKQEQFVPMPVEKQVMIIYVAGKGYLDELPLEIIRKFETEFYPFMDKNYPDVVHSLKTTLDLPDAVAAKIDEAAAKFKTEFKTKNNLK